MRFSALGENTTPDELDIFPGTDVSDSTDKKMSLRTLAAWLKNRFFGATRESFTFNGISVVATKSGGCIQLTFSGVLTAAVASNQAYVDVCTLSDDFKKATYGGAVFYVVLNSNTIGQIRIQTTGAVAIGYTRGIEDAANKNIPSGAAIYTAVTFPGR